LLTVERDVLVAAFVAVMVTPGRTAPVSSVMTPEMEPLLLWPKMQSGIEARSNAKTKRISFACIEQTPFLDSWTSK
jgi:hypothetical protein